jgi:hypothetical protein
MWEGREALLLDEYLRNKVRLQELKRLPERFMTDDNYEEITKLETEVKIFLSMLDTHHLRSLILMGLNIEE